MINNKPQGIYWPPAQGGRGGGRRIYQSFSRSTFALAGFARMLALLTHLRKFCKRTKRKIINVCIQATIDLEFRSKEEKETLLAEHKQTLSMTTIFELHYLAEIFEFFCIKFFSLLFQYSPSMSLSQEMFMKTLNRTKKNFKCINRC